MSFPRLASGHSDSNDRKSIITGRLLSKGLCGKKEKSGGGKELHSV